MADTFSELSAQFAGSGVNPRSDASRSWFLDKVRSIGSFSRDQMLRQDPLIKTPRVFPGMMYMFWYDPKLKQELPYYDKFPLVILVDTTAGGMFGLNLHYLDINIRRKFFYGLLNRVNNTKYDETTRIKLTYNYLKDTRSAKPFKPCFKKYLTGNIRGSIVNVPASEWELAVHMPTASFAKKTESYVHRRSKEMIGPY